MSTALLFMLAGFVTGQEDTRPRYETRYRLEYHKVCDADGCRWVAQRVPYNTITNSSVPSPPYVDAEQGIPDGFPKEFPIRTEHRDRADCRSLTGGCRRRIWRPWIRLGRF